MGPDDKSEFVRVLNGLAAIKRVDLTKEAYEMWWGSMRDWSIDDFRGAAGHLLKTCQFMPSPYDFEQLRVAHQKTGHEAWAGVLEHCKGAYRQGPTGCQLTDAVVESLGGFQTIALMDVDKLGFIERRFLERYDDFVDSRHTRSALPDLSPRSTQRLGKPTRVGDVAKQLAGG